MPQLSRLGRYGIKIGCLVGLGAGIVWNVRLAVADLLAQRHQVAGLRSAMRLMPADGVYAARLADEVYATDPIVARSLLHSAVRLNPYDASAWIQLGLLSEAGNELAAAEAALLQAARVDDTFLPSWSLANFYFRRQNGPAFWQWSRRAAQMDPGDATALFRLAWYVTPSVPAIEHQLQLQRPVMETQFVNFLITRGDPAAVSQAAMHLLQTGSADATPTILGACEWLLAGKRPGLALSLWNGLAARRQIAYGALNPASGADTVTNGQFSHAPILLGFDWHLPAVAGVSSFLNTAPNALGFEFSGQEPDQFVLLSQVAPVEPGKNYALVVDYGVNGIPPDSGLTWKVSDDRTGAVLAGAPGVSSPQGGRALACFATTGDSPFVDVSLIYQRQPGTVRPEGKVTLQNIMLGAASASQCPTKISSNGAASPGI